MNLNIKSLFLSDYWFTFPTSLVRDTVIMYLIVLGVMFLLGIVLKVISGKVGLRGFVKGVLSRFGNLAISGAVIGGIFLFFRYEYVPVLSFRFWFGLWALWMVVWVAMIIKYWFVRSKKYRNEIANGVDRERIEKFLPKRKK